MPVYICVYWNNVRTGQTAVEYIEQGVDRIGTSQTVKVFNEARAILFDDSE